MGLPSSVGLNTSNRTLPAAWDRTLLLAQRALGTCYTGQHCVDEGEEPGGRSVLPCRCCAQPDLFRAFHELRINGELTRGAGRPPSPCSLGASFLVSVTSTLCVDRPQTEQRQCLWSPTARDPSANAPVLLLPHPCGLLSTSHEHLKSRWLSALQLQERSEHFPDASLTSWNSSWFCITLLLNDPRSRQLPSPQCGPRHHLQALWLPGTFFLNGAEVQRSGEGCFLSMLPSPRSLQGAPGPAASAPQIL